MMERPAIDRAWIYALGASLVLFGAPARSTASPYKITVLKGAEWGHLNNLGQVAGIYAPDPGLTSGYAYFYDSNPGGQVAVSGVTLPTTSEPGSYDFRSAATSLNDRGQGIGYSKNPDDRVLQFDARSGATTELPFLADYRGSDLQITNGGEVYGSRLADRGVGYLDFRPFVFRGGAFQDLELPPGTNSSRVVAADDAGHVLLSVAHTADGLSYGHPFLLSDGKLTDLGSLGLNGNNTRVMNAHGDVVGAATFLGSSHAVLVPNGGQMIELGTLPGDAFSMAYAINNKGQIVGTSVSGDDEYRNRGFLHQNGVMTDVNDLVDANSGWLIKQAFAINDRGQMLVNAEKDGLLSALLLTPDGLPTPPDLNFPEMPVPEPSTLVVFGLAAVGLGYRKWKKSGASAAC